MKELINKYYSKVKFPFIMTIIALFFGLLSIYLIFVVQSLKRRDYYQKLKDNLQEDIGKYIKTYSPYCSFGSSSSIDEKILIVQAGIDKNKFLDIDGKSYCKVKVNVRCIDENKHDWDTYIKCKNYEDKEYNLE